MTQWCVSRQKIVLLKLTWLKTDQPWSNPINSRSFWDMTPLIIACLLYPNRHDIFQHYSSFCTSLCILASLFFCSSSLNITLWRCSVPSKAGGLCCAQHLSHCVQVDVHVVHWANAILVSGCNFLHGCSHTSPAAVYCVDLTHRLNRALCLTLYGYVVYVSIRALCPIVIDASLRVWSIGAFAPVELKVNYVIWHLSHYVIN